MKRMLMTVAIAVAAVFASVPLAAQESVTRDIDISVTLYADGGADICEIWDMSIWRGTEWYLVRENLGDIEISDLTVGDENGRIFTYENEWDIDRSIEEKEGRCGIVRKRNGCEICWGLGSWGNHVFTVSYHMSNVVKSYDDYDALHMQFVSSGISPLPQNARVTISLPGRALNDTVCRVWAFGYEGTDGFRDGSVVARTSAPFTSDRSSMILLVRFDKGMMHPQSIADEPFQDKLDEAFEGSSYEQYEEEERFFFILSVALVTLGIGVIVFAVISSIRKRNLRLFGLKKISEIGWTRTLPFNGNLEETAYVLTKCNRLGSEGNFCSALILQMVKKGVLSVIRENKKVSLSFCPNADLSSLSTWQRDFYDMLKESAGEDGMLQEKEFSKWSKKEKNAKRVSDWVTARQGAGVEALHDDGYVNGRTFTPDAQMHARSAIGFKKFLEDFTLISERGSEEVVLWQDYIIFAALYGIADKVAKELKDIDPKAFEEVVGCDYGTMNSVLHFSSRMGHCTVNAISMQQSASSVGGHGGFSSFGGGGGFSGGGHGGGAR